jgi:hypothetical protein
MPILTPFSRHGNIHSHISSIIFSDILYPWLFPFLILARLRLCHARSHCDSRLWYGFCTSLLTLAGDSIVGSYLHAEKLAHVLLLRVTRDENRAKRTELSGAIFVFIFLCGNRNEYRNTKNKYENRYFQKWTWNEYGVNTDEKRMIIGTKRPPKSCSKTQASQVNRKNYSPNLSRLLSVMRE